MRGSTETTFADAVLGWCGFAFIAAAVLLGPWLFGAWEVWWFWPLVACLFFSTLLFAVRLIARPWLTACEPEDRVQLRREERVNRVLKAVLTGSCLPFLVYAAWAFGRAEVFADAERSFLLFLTPFLIGVQIMYGFSVRQRRALFAALALNLLLLGLYGIVNHVFWDNAYVLWEPGEPQYNALEKRATGSYYCPNHFAGIMELAFCIGAAALLTRDVPWRRRSVGAALAVVGVTGVVLSKSRGGGATVLAIAAACLVAGFVQWPVRVRWAWRLVAASVGLLLLVAFIAFGGGYVQRCKEYVRWDKLQDKSWSERVEEVGQRLRVTSRGRMFGGALRAWRMAPWTGVGPGMHQNLWPHIAATDDGDRGEGRWPSLLNNNFHSYEVHSDWLQLIEEYGVAGLVLLLAPTAVLAGVLVAGLRREQRSRRARDWEATGRRFHAEALAGLLALIAMVFHSLGDFNLQMPGTVWLLAALVAVPVSHILNGDNAASRGSVRRRRRSSREV